MDCGIERRRNCGIDAYGKRSSGHGQERGKDKVMSSSGDLYGRRRQFNEMVRERVAARAVLFPRREVVCGRCKTPLCFSSGIEGITCPCCGLTMVREASGERGQESVSSSGNREEEASESSYKIILCEGVYDEYK